ncbi:MAG: hypothetical protein COV76_00390 [Candidatus Omnitrophica bacterium CG11_big_fil_rev_8_21_14_0_20_64_10]|nr:MAG: hypothetical protein COV76_00390 [Candidatus Omnitrophica bacterium CG11_big_fil_rev_8_21_14_0_20_64_10]
MLALALLFPSPAFSLRAQTIDQSAGLEDLQQALQNPLPARWGSGPLAGLESSDSPPGDDDSRRRTQTGHPDPGSARGSSDFSGVVRERAGERGLTAQASRRGLRLGRETGLQTTAPRPPVSIPTAVFNDAASGWADRAAAWLAETLEKAGFLSPKMRQRFHDFRRVLGLEILESRYEYTGDGFGDQDLLAADFGAADHAVLPQGPQQRGVVGNPSAAPLQERFERTAQYQQLPTRDYLSIATDWYHPAGEPDQVFRSESVSYGFAGRDMSHLQVVGRRSLLAEWDGVFGSVRPISAEEIGYLRQDEDHPDRITGFTGTRIDRNQTFDLRGEYAYDDQGRYVRLTVHVRTRGAAEFDPADDEISLFDHAQPLQVVERRYLPRTIDGERVPAARLIGDDPARPDHPPTEEITSEIPSAEAREHPNRRIMVERVRNRFDSHGNLVGQETESFANRPKRRKEEGRKETAPSRTTSPRLPRLVDYDGRMKHPKFRPFKFEAGLKIQTTDFVPLEVSFRPDDPDEPDGTGTVSFAGREFARLAPRAEGEPIVLEVDGRELLRFTPPELGRPSDAELNEIFSPLREDWISVFGRSPWWKLLNERAFGNFIYDILISQNLEDLVWRVAIQREGWAFWAIGFGGDVDIPEPTGPQIDREALLTVDQVADVVPLRQLTRRGSAYDEHGIHVEEESLFRYGPDGAVTSRRKQVLFSRAGDLSAPSEPAFYEKVVISRDSRDLYGRVIGFRGYRVLPDGETQISLSGEFFYDQAGQPIGRVLHLSTPHSPQGDPYLHDEVTLVRELPDGSARREVYRSRTIDGEHWNPYALIATGQLPASVITSDFFHDPREPVVQVRTQEVDFEFDEAGNLLADRSSRVVIRNVVVDPDRNRLGLWRADGDLGEMLAASPVVQARSVSEETFASSIPSSSAGRPALSPTSPLWATAVDGAFHVEPVADDLHPRHTDQRLGLRAGSAPATAPVLASAADSENSPAVARQPQPAAESVATSLDAAETAAERDRLEAAIQRGVAALANRLGSQIRQETFVALSPHLLDSFGSVVVEAADRLKRERPEIPPFLILIGAGAARYENHASVLVTASNPQAVAAAMREFGFSGRLVVLASRSSLYDSEVTAFQVAFGTTVQMDLEIHRIDTITELFQRVFQGLSPASDATGLHETVAELQANIQRLYQLGV